MQLLSFLRNYTHPKRKTVSVHSFIVGAGVGSLFFIFGIVSFSNEVREVGITSDAWTLLLFAGVGLLVAVLVAYSFVRDIRRSREIEKLVNFGIKITGVLTDVRIGREKKQQTHQLVVTAADPNGVVKEYISDTLIGIPAGLAGADLSKHPVPFDVFIDTADFSNYYVDLGDIPKFSVERLMELVKAGEEKFGNTDNQNR